MNAERSVALCLVVVGLASRLANAQEQEAAPAAVLPPWMDSLPAADPAPLLPESSAAARKVTLEGWTRNAIAVTEASPLAFNFKVESGMRLEVAFAIVPDADDRAPVPVDFTISL